VQESGQTVDSEGGGYQIVSRQGLSDRLGGRDGIFSIGLYMVDTLWNAQYIVYFSRKDACLFRVGMQNGKAPESTFRVGRLAAEHRLNTEESP
jgi:hypothetical protein